MRYLGGKSRLAKEIAAEIAKVREPGQDYLEPFMGGCAVLSAVPDDGGVRYASDACEALVTMFRELQDGWDPPEHVSVDDWNWQRALQDPADPLTAFIGFGCSFSATWFGAYARLKRGDDNSDVAASVRRGLIKQRDSIATVRFDHKRYEEWDPEGMLVYCDPPYADTTGYRAVDKGTFDHEAFWETMFKWAKRNTVLVSEFTYPDDPGLEVIWQKRRKVTVNTKQYHERNDLLIRVMP